MFGHWTRRLQTALQANVITLPMTLLHHPRRLRFRAHRIFLSRVITCHLLRPRPPRLSILPLVCMLQTLVPLSTLVLHVFRLSQPRRSATPQLSLFLCRLLCAPPLASRHLATPPATPPQPYPLNASQHPSLRAVRSLSVTRRLSTSLPALLLLFLHLPPLPSAIRHSALLLAPPPLRPHSAHLPHQRPMPLNE